MTETVDRLSAVPAAWRTQRALLADRDQWTVTDVTGTAEAVLVEVDTGRRPVLLGYGDPVEVRRLVAGHERPVQWVTLPRLGEGPGGVHGGPPCGAGLPDDDDLPPGVRARFGVEAFSSWDRMSTSSAPDQPAPVEGMQPRALDPVEDAPAIRACLAEANPGSRADPGEVGEAAWFGVASGERTGHLLGVVGASLRRGDPAGGDLSWHVHGLGVRPAARRLGLGAVLTAAVTRAGLAAGADWVSLGLYASNDGARRVYERLGYRVEGRFTSYRRGPSAPSC